MQISVIVPIYNVKEYLTKCIESIVNQTYKNIEIILVDDGSNDGSNIICDEWRERDNRIKVVHETNGGRVCARRKGAEIATGDYITTIDGDDWIESDRIENIVKNGIIEDVDIVFLSGWIKEYPARSELGEVSEKLGNFKSEEVLEMLSHTDRCFKRTVNPSMCCMVVKHDIFSKAIKKIDYRIQMGEDIAFTWIALSMAKTVRIIEDNMYHYVQRKESINHTITDKDIESIKLSYIQVKKSLNLNKATDYMYKQLAFTYLRLLTSVGAGSFWNCETAFLFPFRTITTNSKVIVYGAGDVGKKLVHFLEISINYSCVGWIDKYSHGIEMDGIVSKEIDIISSIEYDYIAIAIVNSDIADEVRKNLVEIGVPYAKISVMSPEVITITNTEKCLGIYNSDEEEI